MGEPRPREFPAGVVCGAGCTETVGFRCEYRDSSGVQCGWFCRNHTVFLHERPSCRRHASISEWLGLDDSSSYAGKPLPAVEDRSPNLVGLIVDLLDPDVSGYLRGRFATHPAAQVVTDSHVRPASIHDPRSASHGAASGRSGLENRQVAWERGWGVYSELGYLARVALRVTEAEPPVVHMFVSDALVFSRTPDWIANRGLGTDPEADREEFRSAVMEALVKNAALEDA